jgi:type IV pilus assembly protein PilX
MKRAPIALVRQKGTSLLVAMVALVAMMTAGMALIRSVDSANLAAGNFQMQQSAEQNIDMGINEALLAYLQSPANAALSINNRNISNPATAYWAIRQLQSTEGVPLALVNLPAPTWTASGPALTGWPGEQIDANSMQLRRYYVERLCEATIIASSPAGIASANDCQMYTMEYPSDSISNTGASDSDVLPYVRMTVRVDGPKGTTSYAQMFMKGE